MNNRKVNAITIMDSGTVDGWAKNGEIVITSSRMMPEDMDVAKQLLAQLVEKGVVALMVKPYSPDGTGEFPQVLIDYGNQLNFPLFKIEPSATYIQILNDINALLLENRRINKMADLDLDYLLKSNSASDKDFDFVSGLKDINLYELNVRVTKIVLGETPSPVSGCPFSSTWLIKFKPSSIGSSVKEELRLTSFLNLPTGPQQFHFLATIKLSCRLMTERLTPG